MFLNQSLRFSCLLLLVGWFLSSLLNAFDLDTEKPPKGKLGMSLDYQFANKGTVPTAARRGAYVWSTHLMFNGNVQSIRDGQLIKLLWDAWAEVVDDAKQYEFGPKWWPGAITILAFRQRNYYIFVTERPFIHLYIQSYACERTSCSLLGSLATRRGWQRGKATSSSGLMW